MNLINYDPPVTYNGNMGYDDACRQAIVSCCLLSYLMASLLTKTFRRTMQNIEEIKVIVELTLLLGLFSTTQLSPAHLGSSITLQ